MRCPDCKHDQKYKDGTRCGKCGYQFVLLRKKGDNLSDLALRQMIQRLSDNGQYAFTATQLALEICRYWRGKAWGPFGCGVVSAVIVVAGLGFLWKSEPIAGLLIGIGIALCIVLPLAMKVGSREKNTLPFRSASQLIDKYHRIHPIAGLADGKAFTQPTMGETQDLHYAPERILVVEREDLVDMLIRNRFHLASKTAVVSCSGYPAQIVAACREFLRRHPNTPVQLLHDASLKGFNLGEKLAADSHWLLAPHPFINLGISREALKSNMRLPWLTDKRFFAESVFSTDHSAMLRAGRRVPVDCLAPKPLLGLLGAAVISGALTLAAAEASGEIGVEVEVDYG